VACLCVLREGTFVRLAQGTQLEPLSIHIKESRARACVCVCVCVCRLVASCLGQWCKASSFRSCKSSTLRTCPDTCYNEDAEKLHVMTSHTCTSHVKKQTRTQTCTQTYTHTHNTHAHTNCRRVTQGPAFKRMLTSMTSSAEARAAATL
jgi:hypothetical protein